MPSSSAHNHSSPTRHYDNVVDAWRYLLGEDLHYGYFPVSSPSLSLSTATDALTDQMLGLAKPARGYAVLDVGCGTGKTACRLADEAELHVTGITPSQVCIDSARDRSTALGLVHRTDFVVADGMAMCFPDQSYDLVWVMESSHLMSDKSALLSECSRVLKPGGRFVLCDIVLGKKLSLEDVIANRDEFLLLRDVFGQARMETLSFYREGLKSRGIAVDHYRNISAETFPTFDHWRSNALDHTDQVTDLLGPSACREFLLACDVLSDFWQRGILQYGIVAGTRLA